MMKTRPFSRLCAALLALVLVIGCVPVTAFAAEWPGSGTVRLVYNYRDSKEVTVTGNAVTEEIARANMPDSYKNGEYEIEIGAITEETEWVQTGNFKWDGEWKSYYECSITLTEITNRTLEIRFDNVDGEDPSKGSMAVKSNEKFIAASRVTAPAGFDLVDETASYEIKTSGYGYNKTYYIEVPVVEEVTTKPITVKYVGQDSAEIPNSSHTVNVALDATAITNDDIKLPNGYRLDGEQNLSFGNGDVVTIKVKLNEKIINITFKVGEDTVGTASVGEDDRTETVTAPAYTADEDYYYDWGSNATVTYDSLLDAEGVTDGAGNVIINGVKKEVEKEFTVTFEGVGVTKTLKNTVDEKFTAPAFPTDLSADADVYYDVWKSASGFELKANESTYSYDSLKGNGNITFTAQKKDKVYEITVNFAGAGSVTVKSNESAKDIPTYDASAVGTFQGWQSGDTTLAATVGAITYEEAKAILGAKFGTLDFEPVVKPYIYSINLILSVDGDQYGRAVTSEDPTALVKAIPAPDGMAIVGWKYNGNNVYEGELNFAELNAAFGGENYANYTSRTMNLELTADVKAEDVITVNFYVNGVKTWTQYASSATPNAKLEMPTAPDGMKITGYVGRNSGAPYQNVFTYKALSQAFAGVKELNFTAQLANDTTASAPSTPSEPEEEIPAIQTIRVYFDGKYTGTVSYADPDMELTVNASIANDQKFVGWKHADTNVMFDGPFTYNNLIGMELRGYLLSSKTASIYFESVTRDAYQTVTMNFVDKETGAFISSVELTLDSDVTEIAQSLAKENMPEDHKFNGGNKWPMAISADKTVTVKVSPEFQLVTLKYVLRDGGALVARKFLEMDYDVKSIDKETAVANLPANHVVQGNEWPVAIENGIATINVRPQYKTVDVVIMGDGYYENAGTVVVGYNDTTVDLSKLDVYIPYGYELVSQTAEIENDTAYVLIQEETETIIFRFIRPADENHAAAEVANGTMQVSANASFVYLSDILNIKAIPDGYRLGTNATVLNIEYGATGREVLVPVLKGTTPTGSLYKTVSILYYDIYNEQIDTDSIRVGYYETSIPVEKLDIPDGYALYDDTMTSFPILEDGICYVQLGVKDTRTLTIYYRTGNSSSSNNNWWYGNTWYGSGTIVASEDIEIGAEDTYIYKSQVPAIYGYNLVYSEGTTIYVGENDYVYVSVTTGTVTQPEESDPNTKTITVNYTLNNRTVASQKVTMDKDATYLRTADLSVPSDYVLVTTNPTIYFGEETTVSVPVAQKSTTGGNGSQGGQQGQARNVTVSFYVSGNSRAVGTQTLYNFTGNTVRRSELTLPNGYSWPSNTSSNTTYTISNNAVSVTVVSNNNQGGNDNWWDQDNDNDNGNWWDQDNDNDNGNWWDQDNDNDSGNWWDQDNDNDNGNWWDQDNDNDSGSSGGLGDWFEDLFGGLLGDNGSSGWGNSGWGRNATRTFKTAP